MSAEVFSKSDLEIGKRVELIALCSHVEVLQNLMSVGSHRQVYHLHGKDTAYVSGLIFKPTTNANFDVEIFKDEPVLVVGTMGEYKGVMQLNIESITPVGNTLNKFDLLAEMVNTRVLDNLNDYLFEMGSESHLQPRFLQPPLGLEETGAGILPERLLKFLKASSIIFPEKTGEYFNILPLIGEYYLNKEGSINDRIDTVRVNDSRMLRALLFGTNDYPDYTEFVQMHHLLVRPRGLRIEILDSAFNTVSNTDNLR